MNGSTRINAAPGPIGWIITHPLELHVIDQKELGHRHQAGIAAGSRCVDTGGALMHKPFDGKNG
jgi:hypothetical protein